MKKIIAVNTNTYHNFPIEEALVAIKEIGFKYIELTATKGWTEHVFPSQSFSYLIGIKNKIKELGLIPFSLSGHTSLIDKDRLNDFIMNIELAHFFGAEYIVSSIGEAHIKNEAASSETILIENLKSLIPILKRNKIKLVLETHGFDYPDGESINSIVKKIDSKWIKINYDTANVIFYGNKMPEDDIKSCINNVEYIHLKDKDGEHNEWNFPAIGKGYVNFPKIFKRLDKAENNCPLSIEIEFTEKGANSIEEVNKALKDSYDYLHNLKMI